MLKRALSEAENTFGADDASVAYVLRTYAAVSKQLGRKHEAKTMQKRVKAIEARIGQQNHNRFTVDAAAFR